MKIVQEQGRERTVSVAILGKREAGGWDTHEILVESTTVKELAEVIRLAIVERETYSRLTR